MSISQLVSELVAAGKTDDEITGELIRKGLSPATATRFLEKAKGGSPTAPQQTAPPPVQAPSAAFAPGTFDPKLRHPNEGPLFAVMARALCLATIKGTGVRVSARQFPELDARCQRAAQSLSLPSPPEVYLIQAGGALNAFATKLLSRKFMIIYSDLADECEDPRQLDFVIGHEMGHLAAGHLRWNAFLWPFMLMPWLGAAYLRAREYTSDRCGY